MANVYNGMVAGLSKIATGTPAAFCRKVSSATITRSANNIRNAGIGGQLQVRKGTDEITLDMTCVGVSNTDLALWFPTTAGVQVASFPDFLVEVDDGSNGLEYVLSGGQPSSATITCSGGAASQLEVQLQAKFTTATEQAAGTDVPVYNSVIGHTINDIAVAQGTRTYGALSFSLSCDLGTEMVNTMDGKSASAKTIPTSYIITTVNPSLTVETTDEWQMDTMDGDTWTAGNITITCANGVTAENSTITLTNWVPSELNIPLEAEGMVSFGHSFEPGSGTIYNRVAFS